MKAHVLLITLLIVSLPFLIAAAPPTQEPLPDDFIVYGISLAAVAAVIVAIVRKYSRPSEELVKVLAAGLTVGAYVIAANLTVLENLIPSLPVWLPQLLTGILIFGAVLGLAPGETFGKAVSAFRRRG